MWIHNKLDDVHRGLLDHGIVEISGDIDGDMAMYVREAMLRLTAKGSPAVKVIITSGGGSVSCGLDIYDTLAYYSGEKTGVVQGFAKSMAAIVLQACQKRQSMRHAYLLVHHISTTQVGLDSMRKKAKMARIKKEAEDDQVRLYKILGDRTGHTVSEIRRACAKNQSMNAEEALEFGLIDEII
jgi:ATP-dependent Clp protease protease subunit